MPAHFQQSVLRQLIPMLVVLSIVAAYPSIAVQSRTPAHTSHNDIVGEAREGVPYGHSAEYEFAYGVQDPVTGDHKDQWERRIGDRVKGVYTFEEADGTQRIVEYEADGVRGFRATVTNVVLRNGPSQRDGRHETVAHSYNMLRATSS